MPHIQSMETTAHPCKYTHTYKIITNFRDNNIGYRKKSYNLSDCFLLLSQPNKWQFELGKLKTTGNEMIIKRGSPRGNPSGTGGADNSSTDTHWHVVLNTDSGRFRPYPPYTTICPLEREPTNPLVHYKYDCFSENRQQRPQKAPF